jgi:hypothetical protein
VNARIRETTEGRESGPQSFSTPSRSYFLNVIVLLLLVSFDSETTFGESAVASSVCVPGFGRLAGDGR